MLWCVWYGEALTVSLDISKAFDRVWRYSLISTKLSAYVVYAFLPTGLCVLISGILREDLSGHWWLLVRRISYQYWSSSGVGTLCILEYAVNSTVVESNVSSAPASRVDKTLQTCQKKYFTTFNNSNMYTSNCQFYNKLISRSVLLPALSRLLSGVRWIPVQSFASRIIRALS